MSCEHEVRFTIKPTDDACRFHFDVRAYKDRIVAPDEYSGVTEVTPSDTEQVLATKDKLVGDDIIVSPAPTEYLSTDHNGTFLPSSGNVGFSEVVVDVEPSLESLSVTENGLYLPSGTDGFDRVTVSVPAPEPVLQGKAVNPSETAQHVEPDNGYDGLSAVDVGAIPSSYVGSGVTRRSSSDLSASGNTVNVPSGYYESSGSKSVQSGTAGTPTASKSAVSNHSIAVTPSVSNTEGYISGGTLTGNAITVSASELVSGTKQVSITANGTTTEDVTAYANAQISVNVVNQDYVTALTALGVTEDLADSIGALTTYANGVTGESDTTLSDAVESLADGYGQGGGGISDGYEITALDQDGFPTAVDHYGTEVHRQQYWNRTTADGFWKNLATITFKNVVTSIGAYAFTSCSKLTLPDLSHVTSIGGYAFQNCKVFTAVSAPELTALNSFVFNLCENLTDVYLPKCTNCNSQRGFGGCSALETAQIGSVGYTVTSMHEQAFYQLTQSTLTITIYTDGSHVDSILAKIRSSNGAINATVIFKASEATTYNGTNYQAGDTILTSTP